MLTSSPRFLVPRLPILWSNPRLRRIGHILAISLVEVLGV
jgi:hypothetical protein